MTLEPLLIIELAVLGIGTGFLAGLLGIGGGMLMVPFITIIMSARGVGPDWPSRWRLPPRMATIIFTSISSVRAHHKRGAVRWDIVKRLAPGIVIGSIIGSLGVFALLKGSCWRSSSPPVRGLLGHADVSGPQAQAHAHRCPGPAAMFGDAGGVIGCCRGWWAPGAASSRVPFMTWCNVAIHQRGGTSSALGFPIALAGTLGYVWAGIGMPQMPAGSVGYIYLPALVIISIASMAMAPLGARTAHRMDIRPLKKVFATVLYGLAGYFLLR
jgi:uncharacterized membrane protein YfcA